MRRWRRSGEAGGRKLESGGEMYKMVEKINESGKTYQGRGGELLR